MSKQLFLRMGYKVVILFKRFFWKLEYGKSLRLGQGVVFRNRLSISITGQGTVEIGNNCWICSNVIILKGAKIGNNCVISAGCIIDLEIPDDSIVKMRNKEITVESINYQ